ncbi:MAG TPA: choice-of-anchor tandem repeat GloVer-containing protein [Candidatus Tumulicola sp.]
MFEIDQSGKEQLLYSFKGGNDDGRTPSGQLAVRNGMLFGTTYTGGGTGCYTVGCEIVFSVTTAGAEHVLYSFPGGANGEYPGGPLVWFAGAWYGTTGFGGADGAGTVFSVSPSGQGRIVYSFKDGADGYSPTGLTVAKNTLYVTSGFGGTGYTGALLTLTPSGGAQVIHQFADNRHDGGEPTSGFAVMGGVLYGATGYGGPKNRGMIYTLAL